MRQLTDASGQVTLANTYEPYGNLAQTAGRAQTSYGFTGEWTDPSGLVYLRMNRVYGGFRTYSQQEIIRNGYFVAQSLFTPSNWIGR